jgi:hypothetical protein
LHFSSARLSASKLIVYKADYNILKKLAKRDGTFEGSEDLNVEDYNGINDITKRVKKIQDAFFAGVTYSFDEEGNTNDEKAKPDLNDKKDAYGRQKLPELPDSATHLLGQFYKNNSGGNKPYKSVSVNGISVDLYFKSGGKKSAEQVSSNKLRIPSVELVASLLAATLVVLTRRFANSRFVLLARSSKVLPASRPLQL